VDTDAKAFAVKLVYRLVDRQLQKLTTAAFLDASATSL